MLIDNYKIVYLFSGQGGQYRGMGEQLFSTSNVFKQSIEHSHEYIHARTGVSLINELYEQGNAVFNNLLVTHVAIVAVELAMADVVRELGLIPDFAAGNSLGEFSAAAIAGIWTKETALDAALEQAKSILRSGVEGGMLTILNTPFNEVAHLLQNKDIYLAAEHFPAHFTLSGNNQQLDQLEDELRRLAVQYIRLPVTIPFHCPIIEAGKNDFLYQSSFHQTGKAYQSRFVSGLFAREMDMVVQGYFWEVISQPSDFSRLVRYFEQLAPCIYIDLGPSGTLATFVSYNLPQNTASQVHRVMTPFRQEQKQLAQLAALLGR